jgi:hypothetical protein
VSFLGLVVLTAALLPLLTGGSYRRLAEAPWRWGGLLALGLALQLFLNTDLIPRSRWHDLGFGMLVASYVLLLGFCAGNVLVRGMSVVLIGVALNAFVVTIDQGMPVRVPPDWHQGRVEATVKHHPRVPGDHLLGLTDVIVLRRLDAIVSFGDLIIAFGLVDATFWASRRTRRSRARAPLRDHGDPEIAAETREPADDAAAAESNGAHAAPKPEPAHTYVAPTRMGRGPARRSRSRATTESEETLERLERLERS